MKKCIAVLMVLFLCLLCACSPNSEEEFLCEYYAPFEFSSVEEAIDFLRGEEPQEGQKVLSYSTSEVKSIEIPNEEAFAAALDAELTSVSLSSFYINYTFHVNNVDVPRLEEEYGVEFSEDEQFERDEFAGFMQRITVTCNVKAEEGATLVNFASQNAVGYWEEHPGFYRTGAPLGDMDPPYGYMIYWEDFGNFFSAYVPLHLVDSFFAHYDSLIETVAIRE